MLGFGLLNFNVHDSPLVEAALLKTSLGYLQEKGERRLLGIREMSGCDMISIFDMVY